MSRITAGFGALVMAQAVHSIEEYLGRLWESFPPAAFVSGLISPDLRLGFIVGNIALIGFGLWCLLWPVRGRWPIARVLIWFWVVVETINGIVHPTWSLIQGRYTPGTFTAPILLVTAIYLAAQMRRGWSGERESR